MLASEKLKSVSAIRHAFFTREGGVSNGLYASLNCGPGSGDKAEYVAENRSRAAAKLGGKAERLCTLYQVHGSTVHTVENPFGGARLEGDGMVTRIPGIILGILTADCAPVLLCDPQAKVIGAAHAGWKGAIGGVLPATIDAMEKSGAVRKNIIAAIGPCIAQKSYEVDEAFTNRFLSQATENKRFFVSSRNSGHSQFDLSGYVRYTLLSCGVGSVDTLPEDTYTDEARFFSFRRTTHRGEPDYGRQLSAIMLS